MTRYIKILCESISNLKKIIRLFLRLKIQWFPFRYWNNTRKKLCIFLLPDTENSVIHFVSLWALSVRKIGAEFSF